MHEDVRGLGSPVARPPHRADHPLDKAIALPQLLELLGVSLSPARSTRKAKRSAEINGSGTVFPFHYARCGRLPQDEEISSCPSMTSSC